MNKNTETIKKVLMEWCEPKVEGMSAWEIATKVEAALKEQEIERHAEDYIEQTKTWMQAHPELYTVAEALELVEEV